VPAINGVPRRFHLLVLVALVLGRLMEEGRGMRTVARTRSRVILMQGLVRVLEVEVLQAPQG
jgi:hypothetical protein